MKLEAKLPVFITSYCSFFREKSGVLPNTLVIGYAVLGYSFALFLLTLPGFYYITGILLLCHSMVIAAYLLHECIHGAIFKNTKVTEVDLHCRLALILGWLTGACYGDYQKLKEKHLRHHFERADIIALDYRKILLRYPLLKKLVSIVQFLGLPAVDLLMHGISVFKSLGLSGKPGHRARMFVMLRLIYFLVLYSIGGWLLLLGYGIAYVIFIAVLNFMDAFQHSYLLLEGLDRPRQHSPVRDSNRFPSGYFSRDYEARHTFSNLVSSRYPWLNLLVLNFVYHNVHHNSPSEPWYKLPLLHSHAVADPDVVVNVIPLSVQIRNYFGCRMTRIMAPASDALDVGSNPGAAGVSFLTPL